MEEVTTFCNALEEKFSIEKLDDNFENIYIAPNKRNLILQQHQNHGERTILALDGCNINSAGKDGEIKTTCPKIQELDLSHNNFTSISQILEITKQLDNLRFLNLSHNNFKDGLFDVGDFAKQHTLQKLILTKTGIDFSCLLLLLPVFPNVQELHISLNNLQSVPQNTSCVFPNLMTIHLANNDIKHWQDIENIGSIFPKLKALFIGENPIESITSCQNKANLHFPELKKLSLSETLIKKWICLEKLNHFPKLTDLRCKNIPLLKNFKSEKNRHNMLMVRLPKLKYINGSEINESEREDAERKLIRQFKDKQHKPSCYTALLEIHGELDDLVDVDLDKSEHVTLTLTGDIEKSMILKLDIGMTCKDVITHVGKILSLPEKNFRLVAVHASNPESDRDLIDWKTRRLRTYYFEDGDMIEVQRLSK